MQSIAEVATALDVSERTVRRIIRQHGIPTSTLKRETSTGTRSFTAVSFDIVQQHLQGVAIDEAPSSGLTYRERALVAEARCAELEKHIALLQANLDDSRRATDDIRQMATVAALRAIKAPAEIPAKRQWWQWRK
jgi:DNA-binding transcriptional MerR regulator